MSDILIRGMEMPKSCADCHDADLPTAIAWLGAKCPWAHGIIDPGVYDLRQDRHPNCPLVELPSHGDLIDMDKIRYTELYGGVEVTTANWIDSLPVIVPAERSDTDA
mgnify:CR=1 FL=1